MGSILLVEDTEKFQKIVERTLSAHQVVFATEVDEALQKLRERPFDLILLDIHLPKKSGYSLLSELQNDPDFGQIPVICLTGKAEVTDKVTAFSLGAEDYLVKPFDPLELRARVEAKLAKHTKRHERTEFLSCGDLEVDLSRHRVARVEDGDRVEVPVTQTEFKLLATLVKRPDQVFTRDQLLVAAWGQDAQVLDRAVDVHICSLRKKLKQLSKCIEAVPGVGYRFAPARATGGKKAA